MLLLSFSVAAQDTAPSKNGGSGGPLKFKPINPTSERIDQVDIVGMGAATFTTSNTVDGTAESFRHTQKISITLTPAPGKTGSYQLIFYPESANIQSAATTDNGVVSIYYPLNLFNAIRETLDRSFAAKKKVAVKVVQRPDGYREGTLIF